MLPASGGQNVVILLDDSGSMQERLASDRRTKRIDAAKSALLSVLREIPADTQVGLLTLNGDGWTLPLGPADPSLLQQAVQRMRAAGGTPLGQFMKHAADRLLALRQQQPYGTFRLLIVTDGEANDQDLVDRYLPDILGRGLRVDVIGVDMRQDHSLATRVHSYRRADDQASLSQAISAVVLGESNVSAGDAGESDFELLAGLPDEFATGAIRAMTAPANQPIGEEPVAGDAPPGPVAPAGDLPPGALPPGALPPGEPASPSAEPATGLFQFVGNTCTCCCVVLFGGGVLFLILLGRSTRRRRS